MKKKQCMGHVSRACNSEHHFMKSSSWSPIDLVMDMYTLQAAGHGINVLLRMIETTPHGKTEDRTLHDVLYLAYVSATTFSESKCM